MTPNTCIAKIPLDYNEFGSIALSSKGFEEFDHQISIRLPDGVYWCGDELIASVDFEWPDNHPGLEEIIDEARIWMCENADDDCWEDD